jgi:uncharacterized protein YndB with AHSA1/START domain
MAEVTQEVLVEASPSTIFPFLIDPAKHALWMGTNVELDPRPGGNYRVLARGTHQAVGQFVEVTPNEKVVFSFGWDEADRRIPPGSTQVEITLVPEGNKTRVRLTHRGLPEADVNDHTNGWGFYLNRLATVATGGDPGSEIPAA